MTEPREWRLRVRWSDLYAPVGLGAFLFMVIHDQVERPWLMAGALALMGLTPVMRADQRRREQANPSSESDEP